MGFRPFIYQLSETHDLKGTVSNTSAGVIIQVEGPAARIESFIKDIREKKPPLAIITDIFTTASNLKNHTEFSIIKSKGDAGKNTLISPDVSVCPDCLHEFFDITDRRYRYPFINCTNCGPRYTIIDDIPYDRPKTSMRHFTMCDSCQKEYDDPLDRRFHAQPNACPACGPHVTLHDPNRDMIVCDDPVLETIRLLKQGHIVAIKGLGGFHLAVDAENEDAVRRLRKRKLREEKPFALMVQDLESVRDLAHVSTLEKEELLSNRRPITLLKKREDISLQLAPSVAPKNRYLGIMLPYTPLHCLLFDDTLKTLVMTSGNRSDEPISIDNDHAFENLGGIADYFLIHNRDIYLRSDDSIVKYTKGRRVFIRRSRGFAPVPVFLDRKLPPVLACGAGLKNTVCLTRENRAFISQHIGDVENRSAYDFYEMTIEHLKRMFDIEPEIIAHDMHPDYLSTGYAMKQEGKLKIPVQHHHAHIVSCMAENRVYDPVIGLSFDGTGYGTDGNIWGGEVLLSEIGSFERLAHLDYMEMPGSNMAVKQPWRMAASYLYRTYGNDFTDLMIPFTENRESDTLSFLSGMIDNKMNSPLTSSLGRLFDGVASLIGIRDEATFEGQAAMELEMMADMSCRAPYDFGSMMSGKGKAIGITPLIRGIVTDLLNKVSPENISGRFHHTLILLFTEECRQIRETHHISGVALSGGVFQNSILMKGMIKHLEADDFHVFTQSQVSPNDGGISLGQALIAAEKAEKN